VNGKPTDGPYSETKEVLGGFYLIEAADYDEAVARTGDHPHLEHGGTIEIRKLYGQGTHSTTPVRCSNTCSAIRRAASRPVWYGFSAPRTSRSPRRRYRTL